MSTELVFDYRRQHPSAPSSTSSSSSSSTTTTQSLSVGNNNSNAVTNTTTSTALRSLPPRNLHAVATARVIQQQVTAAKIRPIIQLYLQSKDPSAIGEKTVIIMSSKVAQKSYGTEKRKQKSIMTPPKVTVCISGESSSQTGQVEWYSQINAAVVGQTGFPRQQTQSMTPSSTTTADLTNTNNTRFKSHSNTEIKNNGGDWYHNPRMEPLGGGRCVSKQLYINDADEKRKRVECLVKLQVHGQWMGTLAGKGIKVISKPSKKRQSIKNMELCIHHGSVVSLFNRIRSQTVSTKYLGVSNGNDSPFAYPGQSPTEQSKSNDGTCFVARTASWDPFVIWLVDTSRPPEQQKFRDENTVPNQPEDYIGHRAFKPSVNYPPPPAIALRNTTQQPLAIHYNQHIVLQCLTTGLVSPVMIIRKVDKASTVVGGARCLDEPLLANGGEYGDEMLGDPVSQLHKIALQIVHDPSQTSNQQRMLPRYTSPVTYLACLNDMVGMHRSSEQRQPILKNPPPPPPHQPASFAQEEIIEEGGRVVRKRKVSTFVNQPHPPSPTASDNNSMQNGNWVNHRARSVSIPENHHRRVSTSSAASSSSTSWINGPLGGAYWYEDVSDAAVWTLVGTDIASYTFLPPTSSMPSDNNTSLVFPHLSHYSVMQDDVLQLHGDNLARDLQVWLGDIKAPHVEYKSRELVICRLPSRQELMDCTFVESYQAPISSTSPTISSNNLVNAARIKTHYQLPLLLVKAADGIIHKTNIFYQF
ncbi:uncharacterized protein BX664DRAFT_263008 [Halteromyces radiatus]|uniref:uncharacterized protein n=1 Tax=Halteromyces radiatus TaxID=101107 RepID=UPI00221FFDA9|nr:uncharacterized protein BX664DRAFT_263008 [Halteromyces radiatus]KAI8089643.1 hypothetical protein BX664DRAFT_263008 [Halteromyces radiatus]